MNIVEGCHCQIRKLTKTSVCFPKCIIGETGISGISQYQEEIDDAIGKLEAECTAIGNKVWRKVLYDETLHL